MNKKYTRLHKACSNLSLTAIILGMLVFLSPDIVLAMEFQGSEWCQDCHEGKYSDWKASGHPYKLMKSEEARNRPIPLPGGFKWDDISWVIGGYKWKSRYIDNDGYIITTTYDEDGTPIPGVNQYNYLTGAWSDYHAGEEDKHYNCGACHTTNWVANETPEDLSGNQDGLPGMHGTFDAGGIHCEQCHGNGYEMKVDRSAAFCGTCHIRGEADTIPASGGFIRHHEQYNEFLASPHSFFECTFCHDPHKRAEFSIKAECSNCHSALARAYEMTPMAGQDVECEDCHMAYATKSAQALGDFQGDIKTHLFNINIDPDANMFTEDGKFVALDEMGEGAVTMDFACKRCHTNTAMDELARHAIDFHDENRGLKYNGLTPGIGGTWWNKFRSGEGFAVEVAYSKGVLVIYISFYTYDDMGNQVWLNAVGEVTGSTSVEVTITMTRGGKWGDEFDPADVERIPWGSGTFTFPTCTVGNARLVPNDAMMAEGFRTYTQNLTRDLLDSGLQCPTFVGNP